MMENKETDGGAIKQAWEEEKERAREKVRDINS